MKIRKAVITAAGYGTRMLPATKSMPKEMLPILDKPAIQYIVEECALAGITDILIILSRGKQVVEDHFDRSPDLEQRLLKSGKDGLCGEMVKISSMANISYVRQAEQLGLGHAILCAKALRGTNPLRCFTAMMLLSAKTRQLHSFAEPMKSTEKALSE